MKSNKICSELRKGANFAAAKNHDDRLRLEHCCKIWAVVSVIACLQKRQSGVIIILNASVVFVFLLELNMKSKCREGFGQGRLTG